MFTTGATGATGAGATSGTVVMGALPAGSSVSLSPPLAAVPDGTSTPVGSTASATEAAFASVYESPAYLACIQLPAAIASVTTQLRTASSFGPAGGLTTPTAATGSTPRASAPAAAAPAAAAASSGGKTPKPAAAVAAAAAATVIAPPVPPLPTPGTDEVEDDAAVASECVDASLPVRVLGVDVAADMYATASAAAAAAATAAAQPVALPAGGGGGTRSRAGSFAGKAPATPREAASSGGADVAAAGKPGTTAIAATPVINPLLAPTSVIVVDAGDLWLRARHGDIAAATSVPQWPPRAPAVIPSGGVAGMASPSAGGSTAAAAVPPLQPAIRSPTAGDVVTTSAAAYRGSDDRFDRRLKRYRLHNSRAAAVAAHSGVRVRLPTALWVAHHCHANGMDLPVDALAMAVQRSLGDHHAAVTAAAERGGAAEGPSSALPSPLGGAVGAGLAAAIHAGAASLSSGHTFMGIDEDDAASAFGSEYGHPLSHHARPAHGLGSSASSRRTSLSSTSTNAHASGLAQEAADVAVSAAAQMARAFKDAASRPLPPAAMQLSARVDDDIRVACHLGAVTGSVAAGLTLLQYAPLPVSAAGPATVTASAASAASEPPARRASIAIATYQSGSAASSADGASVAALQPAVGLRSISGPGAENPTLAGRLRALPLIGSAGGNPSVMLPPVAHAHPLAPTALLDKYVAPVGGTTPSPRGRRASVASVASLHGGGGGHHNHRGSMAGGVVPDVHSPLLPSGLPSAAADVGHARAVALQDVAALKHIGAFLEARPKATPRLPERVALEQWAQAHRESVARAVAAEKAAALVAAARASSRADRSATDGSAHIPPPLLEAEAALLEARTAPLRAFIADTLAGQLTGALLDVCRAQPSLEGGSGVGGPDPVAHLRTLLLQQRHAS